MPLTDSLAASDDRSVSSLHFPAQASYSIPIAVREIGPMLDYIHGKEKFPSSSGISR
jgi:hypothetical protein